MSIRTTVSLDDDVVANLKELSLAKGIPFKSLLNQSARIGLMALKSGAQRKRVKIVPFDMGLPKLPNLDNIGEVIEFLEGDSWR